MTLMVSVQHTLRSIYARLPALHVTSFRKPALQDIEDIECSLEDGHAGGHLDRLAAWKYIGYPGFSRWLSKSDRFAIRRFSALNTRVLLDQQNEIVKLERELATMDDFAKKAPLDQGGCGSLRTDATNSRGRLVKKISRMLRQYNENLTAFLELQERPSATNTHVNSLRRWILARPNVIERPEQEFLFENADDLVVVGACRADDPDAQCSLVRHTNRPQGLRKRWEAFKCLVISLSMLLGPLWALTLSLGIEERLIVVSSFTVLFSFAVIFGTPLRTLQRYLAIAGYFATLVIILDLVATSLEASDLENYQ